MKRLVYLGFCGFAVVGLIIAMNSFARTTEYRTANCNDVASQPPSNCKLAKDLLGFPFTYAENTQKGPPTFNYIAEITDFPMLLLDIFIMVGIPGIIGYIYLFRKQN